MKVTRRALVRWMVVAMVAISTTTSCGSDASGLGDVLLEVEVADGSKVSDVEYEVIHKDLALAKGVIPMTDNGAAAGAYRFVVPAGRDYLLSLRAFAEEETVCAAETRFDVIAGQTVRVQVALDCEALVVGGSVDVDGEVNSCPTLESVVAAPLRVQVGTPIGLRAEGSDPDSDPLWFTWAATSGTFADASAPETRFFCSRVDSPALSITLDDGRGCESELSFGVTCDQPENCGDGEVDGNEQCDDGNTRNGDGCSSVCIREECGNGIPDPREECDDGNSDDADDCRNNCTLSDEAVCRACEEDNCRAFAGADVYGGCIEAKGNASHGPAAGAPKRELCVAYLECVRTTGCDPAPEVNNCYCGSGGDNRCRRVGPRGPCVAEAEAAAESTDVREVIRRLDDTDYVIGNATLLLECDSRFCSGEC